MPTKRSQEMLNLIRSHKKMAGNIGRNYLMKVDPPAETVARLRVNGTTAEMVRGLPFEAIMVTPQKINREDAVILHLHGGAYVSGGMLQCRALISPICAAAGLRAMTFTYHLAPQHKYPVQLQEARGAYQYLLDQGYAPERIALVGESAGGNLALELTLKLREEGKKLPAALALLSPWTDLAQTGESYRTLKDEDATLNAEELMEAAIGFAGSKDRLKDADISPVYADFTGFPPVLIHCGTSEILLSDSEMLESAMIRDGVDVRLFRWVGMCHVFQAFGFEESKASNRQIGEFLLRCVQGKDESKGIP